MDKVRLSGRPSADRPPDRLRGPRQQGPVPSGGYFFRLPFLVQLDDDAAQLQPAVETREPKLSLPAQPARGTFLAQVLTVVGAAVPEPTAPRPGERVLGTEQQQL